MVALRKDGSAFQSVVESRTAVLHTLDPGQRDLAQKFFAATTKSHGLSNGEPYLEGINGAPVLEHLGAHLECKELEILEKPGDHAIGVFEVLNAVLRRDNDPLTVMGSPGNTAVSLARSLQTGRSNAIRLSQNCSSSIRVVERVRDGRPGGHYRHASHPNGCVKRNASQCH
jgi:flavin reductase (DIM6/NTAB) family NADH-FMN oxidoreductase RutF